MAESDVIETVDEDRPLISIEECNVYVLYKRRWFMLFLFTTLFATFSAQYIIFTIISDVVAQFYNISVTEVTYTSVMFLVAYITFSLPGSYLQLKLGVRASVLIGAVLNFIGAWIKVFSIYPDQYWLVLTGQFIIGVGDVFVFPLVSQIASTWFGSHEVGRACSIGTNGILLGNALGYIVPPTLVNCNTNIACIHDGLKTLSLGVAIISSIILFLIIFLFEEEPPSPPSLAQREVGQPRDLTNVIESIKRVVSNRDFLLILAGYAMNFSVIIGLLTLVNPILSNYFPNVAMAAGTIGLLCSILGIVEAFIYGYLLDTYKIYRTTILIIFTAVTLLIGIFTFTVSINLESTFVILIIIGSSTASMTTVAFELAAELTFPEQGSVSAGVLLLISQASLVIFVCVYEYIFYNIAPVYANTLAVILSTLALVVTCMARMNLRRLNHKE